MADALEQGLARRLPPIGTVRNRSLSIWQSAVASVARSEALASNAGLDSVSLSQLVRDHPRVRAATAHAIAAHSGRSLHEAVDVLDKYGADPGQVMLSKLHFDYVEARRTGNEALAAELEAQVRKFSTADWKGWATCVAEYLAYYGPGILPQYRDWRDPRYGNGNVNYSLIQYQLPATATVAVLGDWGTGMPDAVDLLSAVLALKPTAIIHLGDVYYSGTDEECTTNFLDVFEQAFQQNGVKVPVFTIPGNHEYYSGGGGFYTLLDEVASSVQPDASCAQPASFFCLRTEDGAWQFLGMDTGYNDHDPIGGLAVANGPALQPNEIAWHQDKLDNFGGKTVLLSHHQLFSAAATINTYPWRTAYLNEDLYNVFQPYFPRVAGWLWGHEHNLALYENGIFGLSHGRLIGASAYEETQAEDPYASKYPEVPYVSPPVQLSVRDEYMNHGCAMLSIEPGKPISITYYQYPSWGSYDPPDNAQLVALTSETLDVPGSYTTRLWQTSLPGCGYTIVSMLAGDGLAYAASNGYVYALAAPNGSLIATNGLSGRGFNEIRLAYFDGGNTQAPRLVAGSDGYVLGLDPGNVSTVWQTSLPGSGYTIVSVAADETSAYAGSNGLVYKLDPGSGSVQATNSLSGMGYHEIRLAVFGTMLYVGTNGYALGLATSNLGTQWQTSLPGCGYNLVSMATDGQYVYAGSNGYVYKLDPNNGNVLAQNGLSGRGYNEVRLAVAGGILCVGTNGYALGLSTSDLSTQWQTSLPGCGYSIVDVVTGEGELFAGSNGYAYRLNPANGTLLFTDGLTGLGYGEVRCALGADYAFVGMNGYAVGYQSV